MPKISSRALRRLVIVAIFFSVFFFTGLGLQKVVTPVASCTDGIKNGEEEGIDCGLFACNKYCEPDLAPPTIVSTKLLEAGENDYDFVAVIKNPHAQFGASEVNYDLILYNAEGVELEKTGGMFYILPGQNKYLILTHLTTENNVSKIDFQITSAKWQKIDTLEGMNLIVKAKDYKILSGNSSVLDGLIKNESDFDFAMVDLDVVLFDARGEIIGVNHSDIRTFAARSERAFRVVWPFDIQGQVAEAEVFPSTDLFQNLNFIKRYGSEVEKFQDYKHIPTIYP